MTDSTETVWCRKNCMGLVPGRKLEGEYQWSPALKRLALKYYQDSEVQGELDVFLQGMREGPNTRRGVVVKMFRIAGLEHRLLPTKSQ